MNSIIYILYLPKVEYEYVTIIPDFKCFKITIKPLNSMSKKQQLPVSRHVSSNGINNGCEKHILLQGNSSRCVYYTRLNIQRNYLEIIPEINQYLAVFPKDDQIKIECQQNSEIEFLTEIFLIKNENCDLNYKQKNRFFKKQHLEDH